MICLSVAPQELLTLLLRFPQSTKVTAAVWVAIFCNLVVTAPYFCDSCKYRDKLEVRIDCKHVLFSDHLKRKPACRRVTQTKWSFILSNMTTDMTAGALFWINRKSRNFSSIETGHKNHFTADHILLLNMYFFSLSLHLEIQLEILWVSYIERLEV